MRSKSINTNIPVSSLFLSKFFFQALKKMFKESMRQHFLCWSNPGLSLKDVII